MLDECDLTLLHKSLEVKQQELSGRNEHMHGNATQFGQQLATCTV